MFYFFTPCVVVFLLVKFDNGKENVSEWRAAAARSELFANTRYGVQRGIRFYIILVDCNFFP